MLSSMESTTFGEVVWLAMITRGRLILCIFYSPFLTSSNIAYMCGGEHKESGSGLHKK